MNQNLIMNQDLTNHPQYPALLDILVEKKVLSAKDLPQAIRLSREEHGSLARMLVKLGWVSEHDMASTLAENCQFSLASESDYPTVAISPLSISLRFMQNHHLVPVSIDENKLLIIMSDPSDESAMSALRFAYSTVPEIKVGLPSLIDSAIARVYSENNNQDDDDTGSVANEDDIEHLKDLASEAPVIQFVNKVIQNAVEVSASDIHIEPFEKALTIRYRIDGVLTKEGAPANISGAAIISRIKIMAKLDIAERRLPQDGRAMVRAHGKTLDVRVSTLPTVHGESVVMRILDRDRLELHFDTLGFTPEVLTDFLDVLAVPHGIIMVTGPTGSGKSTTLYTAIAHLNTPKVKIITVEDPVEYQLEGVNQLPVRANIGLDFATALRSIVRQDPDVIMIGEMRDMETAKIAIQSALTGHLVLSTLHTNSAAAGITRLLDMGVENYLLVSTINGILGQRLLRKLCLYCREPHQLTVEQRNMMKLDVGNNAVLYRPKGCKACNHTGYSGRTMIIEWLPMTESMRTLVMSNTNADALQKVAIEEGMISMFQDGLAKVVAGITSIDEVLRVTQED